MVRIRFARTVIRWLLMLLATRLAGARLLRCRLLWLVTIRLLLVIATLRIVMRLLLVVAMLRFLLPTILLLIVLRVRIIRPARDDLRLTLLRITLRLDRGNIRQDARIVIDMLQVIFHIHAVAIDLRITRHIVIFTQLLRGVMLLALDVLAVIRPTVSTAAATAIIITAWAIIVATAAVLVVATTVIILTHHIVHSSSAFAFVIVSVSVVKFERDHPVDARKILCNFQ